MANKIRKFLAKASRECELSNFRDVNHLFDIPGKNIERTDGNSQLENLENVDILLLQ